MLVHGIGEQQPMSTLLGFVESVAGGEARFGAPDDIRDRTDQRKMKVTWAQKAVADGLGWNEGDRERRESNTDFFELYWAYQFRDTRKEHVTSWLYALLKRRRNTIAAPRLRGHDGRLWRLARFVVGVVMLGAVALALIGANDSELWLIGGGVGVAVLAIGVGLNLGLLFAVRLQALGGGAATVWWLVLRTSDEGEQAGGPFRSILVLVLLPVATGLVLGFVTKSLGDAARYLTNSPDNVETNEQIRRAGIELLEALHAKTEPSGQHRYHRIVVVGHSLGSVIAYDMIRHLWATHSKELNLPQAGSDDVVSGVVRGLEVAGQALRKGDEEALGRYRQAQWELHRVLRDLDATPSTGRPSAERWIVSDLVTLGSPLAYADLLLASDPKDLEQRRADRMLAACPPVPQRDKVAAASHPYRFRVTGGSKPLATRFHHAAVFAPVRWTNVYFEHDFIGGPVADAFGHGVRDVQLGDGRWWGLRGVVANPHSHYWMDPTFGPLRSLFQSDDREKARVARCTLRALVCRPPSVYVRCTRNLDPASHLELVEALQTHATDEVDTPDELQGRPIDIRVVIDDSTSHRRTVWTPLIGLDPSIAGADLPNARARLAVSPDLHEASPEGDPADQPDDD